MEDFFNAIFLCRCRQFFHSIDTTIDANLTAPLSVSVGGFTVLLWKSTILCLFLNG